MEEQVSCECGCGRLVDKFTTRGKLRRFIPGHNARFSNPIVRDQMHSYA